MASARIGASGEVLNALLQTIQLAVVTATWSLAPLGGRHAAEESEQGFQTCLQIVRPGPDEADRGAQGVQRIPG